MQKASETVKNAVEKLKKGVNNNNENNEEETIENNKVPIFVISSNDVDNFYEEKSCTKNEIEKGQKCEEDEILQRLFLIKEFL
jgi:hypothetical protein